MTYQKKRKKSAAQKAIEKKTGLDKLEEKEAKESQDAEDRIEAAIKETEANKKEKEDRAEGKVFREGSVLEAPTFITTPIPYEAATVSGALEGHDLCLAVMGMYADLKGSTL